MPRRNRKPRDKRPQREGSPTEKGLSGRNEYDLSRMARKLVEAGICSTAILESSGLRRESTQLSPRMSIRKPTEQGAMA
jgi:hypothetical protein